jgi:hypothetical protein
MVPSSVSVHSVLATFGSVGSSAGGKAPLRAIAS